LIYHNTYNKRISQGGLIGNPFAPFSVSPKGGVSDPTTGDSSSYALAVTSTVPNSDSNSGSASVSASFSTQGPGITPQNTAVSVSSFYSLEIFPDFDGTMTIAYTISLPSPPPSSPAVSLNVSLNSFQISKTFTEGNATYQFDAKAGDDIYISATAETSYDSNHPNSGASCDFSWGFSAAPKLQMNSAALSPNGQTVSASYSISGSALPSPGTIDFYWATGPDVTDEIGKPIKVPTQTAVGTYTASAPIASLSSEPTDAKYVIAVADSPSADPANSAVSVAVPLPIVVTSARFPGTTSGVNFTFRTFDIPNAITVSLYRSKGQSFDSTAVLIASKVIKLTKMNPQSGNFTFSSPLKSDPSRPYYLIVAHPTGIATLSVFEFLAPYNTAFLTDVQLRNISWSQAMIQTFLSQHNSYFQNTVKDVDGTSFNLAAVIEQASKMYSINPKVLLATLQKESSGVTRTTRPNMAALMGNNGKTARAQIMTAAKLYDSYQRTLLAGHAVGGGYQRGKPHTTQDGITVIPATNAVAGLFAYNPVAGTKWGGGSLPGVAQPGGVYLFFQAWNSFGF
jgi:hypothetical protein